MEFEHKTLFLDCETSGLVPYHVVPGKRPHSTKKEQMPYETHFMHYPYIVSMAWAIDDEEPKCYILNQEGREIPKEASDIHGITTEIANESQKLFVDCILHFFRDAMGCEIVVGHGLYFDTSIIKASILREIDRKKLGRAAFENITDVLHKHKRIDTMRSSARMMKGWATLSELHFKIFRKGFKAHDNREDLEATRRVYKWLLNKKIVPDWEKLQKKAWESKE